MGKGRNRRRRKRKRRQKQRPAPKIEVRAREVIEVDPGTTCPLCHDGVATDDSALLVMRCDGCRTVYHQACFDELGGCSVLGCGRTKARGGPPGLAQARERIRVRNEARERDGERRRRHRVGDPYPNPGEDRNRLSPGAIGLIAVGTLATMAIVEQHYTAFFVLLILFLLILPFFLMNRGKD